MASLTQGEQGEEPSLRPGCANPPMPGPLWEMQTLSGPVDRAPPPQSHSGACRGTCPSPEALALGRAPLT